MNISSIGVQIISTTTGTPQQAPQQMQPVTDDGRNDTAPQQRAQPAPGTGQQIDKTV